MRGRNDNKDFIKTKQQNKDEDLLKYRENKKFYNVTYH
jgi:hypothetical protein